MKNVIIKIISPVSVILIAAALRLVPHSANFAPIAAIALFGGTYLNKRWAFIIPLAAMLISDYLILYINPFGQPMFNFSHLYPPHALIHGTTLAVYGSFIISGFIGLWLKKHKSAANIIGASLFCSIQFFLITNAAVWLQGLLYDKAPIGLLESYIAGIPFFRGTLAGDLFYTMIFFASYEFARFYLLKKAKVTQNVSS